MLPEKGSVSFCEETQQFLVNQKGPVANEPVFVEGRTYSGENDNGRGNHDDDDKISRAYATFIHAENKNKVSNSLQSDSTNHSNNTEQQMAKKHKKLPVMPAC